MPIGRRIPIIPPRDRRRSKLGKLIADMLAVAVVGLLLFIPNRFHPKYIETHFEGNSFYCGRDVEVWTQDNGSKLLVGFGNHKIELSYYGSTLFSDHYRAEIGEEAEYDMELKLSEFGNGVGGVCY